MRKKFCRCDGYLRDIDDFVYIYVSLTGGEHEGDSSMCPKQKIILILCLLAEAQDELISSAFFLVGCKAE